MGRKTQVGWQLLGRDDAFQRAAPGGDAAPRKAHDHDAAGIDTWVRGQQTQCGEGVRRVSRERHLGLVFRGAAHAARAETVQRQHRPASRIQPPGPVVQQGIVKAAGAVHENHSPQPCARVRTGRGQKPVALDPDRLPLAPQQLGQ